MLAETKWYRRLSREAQVLVDEAILHLSEGYDPQTHIVTVHESGHTFRDIRATMYYALALLETDAQDGVRMAEDMIRTVLDRQLDAPDEVYHGVFMRADDHTPPSGVLDWKQVSLKARYNADMAWEHINNTLDRELMEDPELSSRRKQIEGLLEKALLENVPVAWDTYEPNLREFIGMTFAMILEHFEHRLTPALVTRMEQAGHRLMEGAIQRNRSQFTPLNTNIRIMYIFLLDWFGRRLNTPEWCDEALMEAKKLQSEYHEFHAVAEFNSPTYCGVDLSTLGFWRKYSANPELAVIADDLEAGIWEDMAAFYNPVMRNFSGPYSRAYELDMSVHTCFYDLLYMGLGAERFPWHPYSIESAINPLTVLGDIRIPDAVRDRIMAETVHETVERRFRELSERGDPDDNAAVCTATALITPDLMLGALSGSRNPSYQLHPLVAFWGRRPELGTLCLLRALPDGRMMHMHTVLFDGRVEGTHVQMDVECDVGRDVDIYFEIDCAGAEASQITAESWRLPGLIVHMQSAPAEWFVRPGPGSTLQVVYPFRVQNPVNRSMHFEMTLERMDMDTEGANSHE